MRVSEKFCARRGCSPHPGKWTAKLSLAFEDQAHGAHTFKAESSTCSFIHSAEALLRKGSVKAWHDAGVSVLTRPEGILLHTASDPEKTYRHYTQKEEASGNTNCGSGCCQGREALLLKIIKDTWKKSTCPWSFTWKANPTKIKRNDLQKWVFKIRSLLLYSWK